MKKILLCLFMLSSGCLFGQKNSETNNGHVILNPDFKGKVKLFDRPNGKIIAFIYNDSSSGDNVIFTVFELKDGYFRVSAQYSNKGFIKKGWVRQDSNIGVYARNYEDNIKLILYSEPSVKSKPRSFVSHFINKIYSITDFREHWLKVYVEEGQKKYEGWLSPDMQCANPYTTCN